MSFYYDNTLTSITVPSAYSITGAYAVNGSARMNFGAIRSSVQAGDGSEANFNYFACFAKNATSSSTNDFTGRFRINGLGNTYGIGSFNTSYSDYAEYFESFDGTSLEPGTPVVVVNPDDYELVIQDPDGSPFSFNEINESLCAMTGAFNCFQSIKKKCYIRPATGDDNPLDIIGVVRPKSDESRSSYVGNNSWVEWSDKYITDPFGKREMIPNVFVNWESMGVKYNYPLNMIPKGVRVPDNVSKSFLDNRGNIYTKAKENPLYIPTQGYVPREQRDEWNVIGLLGQVPIKKDQPIHPNWRKLTSLSDEVDMYLIR